MSEKRKTLSEITSGLRSEKVKVRQEAFNLLRPLLQVEPVLAFLDDDRQGWIILYESIFEAFAKDKQTCTKSGRISTSTSGAAAQALKRMSETAQLVRELVDKCIQRHVWKITRVLLENLFSQLRYHGELIEDVSLHFIKTLTIIFSWQPHLDRMEESQWIKYAELCFNVLLNDPFRTRLEDDLQEDTQEEGFQQESSVEDIVMEDPDSMDIDEPSHSSKKRRYPESPQKTQPTRSQSDRRATESKSRGSRVITQEQIELIRLLCVILRSPAAPFTSPSYHFLPAAVLNRMYRLLVMYPNNSSIQTYYLRALSATLSRLTLNRRDIVVKFAHRIWPYLVALWGTREQESKERLITILKQLFPYYTLQESQASDLSYADGVTKLWQALGATEGRKGMEGLSLESLRLRLRVGDETVPFATSTYQHGWHFDDNQALAWAILELQADCAGKMYHLSESLHAVSGRPGKRMKVEDPITSILRTLMKSLDPTVRVYNLQLILFIVSRHWSVLHSALQSEVIHVILQFLSYDDASIQSWCFVCLAAVAHASVVQGTVSSASSTSHDNGPWDGIWAHAMRRSNVPAVCRAACHAAHVLLHNAKVLLSPQRMLEEIEVFAKDLDVQGPAFPYDSVCAFMALCIRIASQDVRLYRMAFEDKALTWLVDSWRPGSTNRNKMPLYTLQDILGLLQSLCGAHRTAELLCELPLPDSLVVTAITEEHGTAVIRDFQLYARLPPFNKSETEHEHVLQELNDTRSSQSDPFGQESVPPGVRERRLSSYFQKTLEEYALSWESLKDSFGHFKVETVRSMLDFSISALVFEASLSINGTQSNRRVLQGACKIIALVMAEMLGSRWTVSEQVMIITAFEPLVLERHRQQDPPPWETLVAPGEDSGIRREILESLALHSEEGSHSAVILRHTLQRAILQSSDVQDTVVDILDTMRKYLRFITDQTTTDQSRAVDNDDLMIRIAKEPGKPSQRREDYMETGSSLVRRAVETCTACLAVFPMLQSTSGEATRDKELLNILLEGDDAAFVLLAPSYFDNVRRGTLALNPSSFIRIADKIVCLVDTYFYARSATTQSLMIHFLHSTMRIWVHGPINELGEEEGTTPGAHGRNFCGWLSKVKLADKMQDWSVRDHLVCFLDELLAADPQQQAWPKQEELSQPSDLLPALGGDDDIRVRFRAASSNARLLRFASYLQVTPEELYTTIRQNLCNSLSDYEEMLTRLLCLGNMMIVSSVVRRGPYWHLVETCLYVTTYTAHIETILSGVAVRLGLPSFSALFEAYASQIAFSIRQSKMDFLRFPPHLLGYQDRKQSAEAAFKAFTPFNLFTGGSTPESITHGRRLFNNHCRVIQRTTEDGFRECFADIVGHEIISRITEHPGNEAMDALVQRLHTIAKETGTETTEEAQTLLKSNADGIVAAVIRTLSDRDVSEHGPIVSSLSERSRSAAREFVALTAYNTSNAFKTHEPNLPQSSTAAILQALDWFHGLVPIHDQKGVSYHVLHRLFADIESEHMVNEQIRLLNAVCLWVACHRDHFDDDILLRTLSRGAANLLSRFDLLRGAQSILQWVLSRPKESMGLAELFIHVACAAQDLSTNTSEEMSRIGLDVLQWIESEALRLFRSTNLRRSIQQALSAWPRDPPTSLIAITEEPIGENLSAILADKRIVSNKFRLVRQFLKLATQDLYEASQFSKSDFWRLKEFIPPTQHLALDDIDSFVKLLLHQGSINGLDYEVVPAQTILNTHLQEQAHLYPWSIVSQRVIMITLLMNLDAPSAVKVHLAFVTLRSALSVCLPEVCPTQYGEELELLKAYHRPSSEREVANLQDLLTLEAHAELAQDFSSWIRYVATSLSDSLANTDRFYWSLAGILQSDADFASEIFPVLVHTVLQAEKAERSQSHEKLLSNYFSAVITSDRSSTASRQVIINTVLHLRCFNPSGKEESDPLSRDKWLHIDFILLSKNAIMCGAYTTALLFLELAVEHAQGETLENPAVERILYDIYDRIDEPDGFYGIQTQNLHQFLIKSFHHENQWDRAFQFHGAAQETSSANSSDFKGLLEAIHSFGFNRMAMTMLEHASGFDDAEDSSKMTYSLGWRTETWDLPDQNQKQAASASLYLALRAVNRERDPKVVDATIQNVLAEEMQTLRSLGNENLTKICNTTQSLMCIEQVRQWQSPIMQQCMRSRKLRAAYSQTFTGFDDNMQFTDMEAIMATRNVLLRSLRRQEQREQLGDMLTPFTRELLELESINLISLSKAARSAGKGQVALNAIIQAQRLSNGDPTFDVSEEFAHVLWMLKEPTLAMQFLRNQVPHLQRSSLADDPSNMVRKALIYARLGTWASEACLEKPAYIKSEFFEPAAALVHKLRRMSPITEVAPASVYRDYAIFAERQYHSIVKAPDSLRLKVLVDRKTLEVRTLEGRLLRLGRNSVEYNPIKTELERSKNVLAEDMKQYDAHMKTRDGFLERAIEMHSRSLATSDEFDDDSAIRVCSLWFANFDYGENSFQGKIATALRRIPSRKFVFLTHQLTARLTRSRTSVPPGTTDNVNNAYDLVLRMCREHSFHCLYSVFCLQADKAVSQSHRHSTRNPVPSSQVERAAAAADIFNVLFNGNERDTARATSIKRVCDAALEWAKFPIKGLKLEKGKRYPVKEHLLILKLKDVNVPVMTAHTPLDPTGHYNNCVWLHKYEASYTIAGGINMPKIMECTGSDGQKYKQLFKGEGADDLRQDAVMEQVFELVNIVLRRDRDTLKRNLRLRTYTVIPIASQAGVLEFVDQTTPLQNWLPSAHLKYARPPKGKHDSWGKVVQVLSDTPDEARVPVFQAICKDWKPVMRHYFTERHKTPMSWFRMRLHYSRSVAATSIVGHILGLGDRHLSNILIHDPTGEMVNIDLGIAFEQGKVLKQPERVPFRLTRDMIDGMGSSGTRGVFQRCAEETLRVLRDGSEVILTVLEVFKYDPLHSWTAREMKLKQVQATTSDTYADLNTEAVRFVAGLDMSAGIADEAADRALSTVTRKLDKGLSVQFTVNELIAEATDVTNLALMFHGWSAWA